MATKMGVDFICFIDENGQDIHDREGEPEADVIERYNNHFKNVKGFEEVKDLRKFEKQKFNSIQLMKPIRKNKTILQIMTVKNKMFIYD